MNESLRDRPMTNREPFPDATMPVSPPKNGRPIIIRPLDRGYIVEVGCSTLAVIQVDELILKLREYLLMPTETERKFLEDKLFTS